MALQRHSGDAQSEITRMVEQYGNDILRMCYLQLRSTEDAKDAVQETFFKAYRSFERYQDIGNEKAWLLRIAINTCRDIKRNGWFRFIDHHKPLESIPQPSEQEQWQDRAITEAILQLRQEQRTAIMLYYYEELPVAEIARILGVKPRRVYALLKSAKKNLHRLLGGDYCHEE